jgi:hypothetical protein
MAPTKPITAWAVASVACSGLGMLAGVPLLLIDYQNIAGATAGVGLIGPFLLGLLSSAFGLVGLVSGLVALGRIGAGQYGGRGMAWAGVTIGALLTMAYLIVAAGPLGLASFLRG